MPIAPPTDLRPYFLTLDDVRQEFGPGCVDWRAVFGNDHPVELDIGCGRGLFLVNAAENRPEFNYLGVELDFREARRSARRLQRRRLDNARIWGGDALVALHELIAPKSASAVHVYFPDPWWKRKHRRRRLFNDRFVDLCADVLVPGGHLHSWTDVAEYFEVIAALVDHDARFDKLPAPPERPATHNMDYHTSFERKGRQAGTQIHRGCWLRR